MSKLISALISVVVCANCLLAQYLSPNDTGKNAFTAAVAASKTPTVNLQMPPLPETPSAIPSQVDTIVAVIDSLVKNLIGKDSCTLEKTGTITVTVSFTTSDKKIISPIKISPYPKLTISCDQRNSTSQGKYTLTCSLDKQKFSTNLIKPQDNASTTSIVSLGSLEPQAASAKLLPRSSLNKIKPVTPAVPAK
jgi:hypothetical protein